MKKIFFVFAIVSTLACEDVDDFEEWDGGADAGDCGEVELDCLDGEGACEGNVLMVCDGGRWVIEKNCLEGQGVCVFDGVVTAGCLYPD
jgi:hypothetical protein